MRKLLSLFIFGGLSLLGQTACWAAEELPRKLDSFVLGEPVLPNSILLSTLSPYVHKDDPLQYVDISTANAKRMLGEILPNYKSGKVSARVRLYRGKLEYIAIGVGDRTFKEIHTRLVKAFGNGLQASTTVSEVLEGCAPYRFQQWSSHRGAELFLIGGDGKGVDIYLRDKNLHSLVEQDDQVHIEYEQCVEF